MNKEYYTVDEVANLLKLSKYTIYEMIKRGDLTGVKVGRKIRIKQIDINHLMHEQTPIKQDTPFSPIKPVMFIGSHDLLLEQTLQAFNQCTKQETCIPAFVGSMEGLLCLYYNRAEFAGCHLYDEPTDSYNLQTVKRLFPTEEMILFHFVTRNIGWIVPKGNPKKICEWSDLQRADLTFYNRQKGSGTRLLLDCYRKKMKQSAATIKGYEKEAATHFSAASAVAKGEADYTLGTESAANALGLDFILLKQEEYDFVMKQSFYNSEQWQRIEQHLLTYCQNDFIKTMIGYDFSQLGKIQEV